MKNIILFISVLFSVNAISWDGVASGKVEVIDITAESNLGFRVTLIASNNEFVTQCNSLTWAYLNKSSSNYQAYVSVLLAAKMAQTATTIYTTEDANGFCHIGYISIR